MKTKYDFEISNSNVVKELEWLVNQTYKLLPSREENLDWQTPLGSIIEEFFGMRRLDASNERYYFSLLCKLEGLYLFIDEKDFFKFRRTIFECINLIGELIKICQD